jgi:hypothetical protein
MDNRLMYDIHHPSNSCVDLFTKNVLFNNVEYCDCWGYWNVECKYYHHGSVIDMFTIKQDSLAMARNFELIYIGDDDFSFQEGSTEVINQCCAYMQDHLNCGAIYLGGNFGGEGDLHGNEIYITNKGHLGTNRGILVRNRYMVLDKRLHAPGANEDFVIGFTCLLQGYYIARRLHVPIGHSRERNHMSEDNLNMTYNLNFLRNCGIMSKVNKLIGQWDDHNIWPKNIFHYYSSMARDRNFIPVYSDTGEII